MRKFISIPVVSIYAVASLFLESCSERGGDTLFTQIPPGASGVDFTNQLQQSEAFNIIEYLYFYNGGGVAAGDINNDGLIDLYFSANQLSNRLYLNKGSFQFEDITASAGVNGGGNWKTGVAMADVNGDGWLDIFVCGVGGYKQFDTGNRLYINNGDLTFTDRTEEFGLAFKGFSTHAVFFDYDNDGDLDMYLLNHAVHTPRAYGHARLRHQSDPSAGDKLYRNELVPEGVTRFTEVTSRSGIYNSHIGYGLGVGASDLNMDGWMDLYVSNDFHENDYLYLNRGDGTYRESVEESIPHVSRFSMGNDIADINDDGLPDIITLDMMPRDEEVLKTTAGEEPFDIYQFKLRFGYHHQFARNTLQLNRGTSDEGQILFSDVAPLAGVEASDWSWAPLLADFDNNGKRDLFIANGILTRPNDLDYISFISSDSVQRNFDYKSFILNMPSGVVPNMFFRNEGDLRFRDITAQWLGEQPSCSTGAAYADLDNDGDLDLVVNNVNGVAGIFRNESDPSTGGWLQLELQGQRFNTSGIGAKVFVFSGGRTIYQEQILSRGWQSSVSPIMHIGVGKGDIDSLRIIWPGGKFQTLTGVQPNRRIKVHQKEASAVWVFDKEKPAITPLLVREDHDLFHHRENDFNAFGEEKLIPHMASTQGPQISTGDINGDGRDDFFIGGAAGQPGQVFFQDAEARFIPSRQSDLLSDSLCEDSGSSLFDADGDGDADLLVASGGQQHRDGSLLLSPRLYLNDGAGILRRAPHKLPTVFVNASCVQVADIDADGDQDVFIGGRVIAKKYGVSPYSYLLINDGNGKFSDGTRFLPRNGELGMVTDAVWCEVNGDDRLDLIVVGEWMPITVLIQDAEGNFHNRTEQYGLDKTNGWWNTILPGDFDGDGDTDFVAGNLGTNSRLRASTEEPVSLYIGDIDQNGGIDHLLTYFNQGKQHPFISRDQLVSQVPSFKREFLKYANFKNVTREQIIPAGEMTDFVVNRVYCFASSYVENRNGRFVLTPLPAEAQMFPIFSFAEGDFDDNGQTDLLAVGNLHAVQPELGRYDAGYGLMLLGNGQGYFRSLSLQASGFVVKGEGRDIARMTKASGHRVYLVSRNNDSMLTFVPPSK